MNWQLVATVVASVFGGGASGTLIGALMGRRAANKNAEAAVQDAFTRAYDAAGQNWARFTEAQQKGWEAQSRELSALAERQTQTEIALEAEKFARHKADRLFSLAIIYLHSIASWVNEHLPGKTLPPPPAELEAHLFFGGHPHGKHSTGD